MTAHRPMTPDTRVHEMQPSAIAHHTSLDTSSTAGQAVTPPSGLATEPCRRPEHDPLGYTIVRPRPVIQLDENGQPRPWATSGRRLFFAWAGCSRERWEAQLPACPAGHQPFRCWVMGRARCQAGQAQSGGRQVTKL